MSCARQGDALSWLGIDTWQLRGGYHRPAASESSAPTVIEPAAEPGAVAAVETRDTAVEAPPAPAVGTVTAATQAPVDGAILIQAPINGAMRRLAERIAQVAGVPAASIGQSSEAQAGVTVGVRSWTLAELLERADLKRELWRCLCRR